jgi:hypothetical protein
MLETFSYIFYYSSCLIGPSFEFADFIKFIRLEEDYKEINYRKCNKAALEDLLITACLIIIVLCFADRYPNSYCGSIEFIQHNFFYKWWYMIIAMLCTRSRYYIGWKMMQASCIFCGLSYYKDKHDDNKEKCDLIDNCNLYQIEINLSIRTRIQYWNRTVHLWLKYHVFMRLINIKSKLFHNNKSLASLLTFMISAIWHGFYPVYYLFFFQYYLIEQCGSALEDKANFIEWINEQNIVLRFLWWFFVMSMVNYFGNVFIMLKMSSMINFFAAFHWIPVIVLVLGFIYCTFILKKKKIIKADSSTVTPDKKTD